MFKKKVVENTVESNVTVEDLNALSSLTINDDMSGMLVMDGSSNVVVSVDVESELKGIEELIKQTHQSFLKLISKLPPNKRFLKPIVSDWPKGNDIESVISRIKKGSFMTREYIEQINKNLYGGK